MVQRKIPSMGWRGGIQAHRVWGWLCRKPQAAPVITTSLSSFLLEANHLSSSSRQRLRLPARTFVLNILIFTAPSRNFSLIQMKCPTWPPPPSQPRRGNVNTYLQWKLGTINSDPIRIFLEGYQDSVTDQSWRRDLWHLGLMRRCAQLLRGMLALVLQLIFSWHGEQARAAFARVRWKWWWWPLISYLLLCVMR